MISGVFQRMERWEKDNASFPAPSVPTSDPSPPLPPKGQQPGFKSVNHRDAYLLFRSLSKLSMKSIPDQPDLGYTYSSQVDAGSSASAVGVKVGNGARAGEHRTNVPTGEDDRPKAMTEPGDGTGSPALSSKVRGWTHTHTYNDNDFKCPEHF